MPLKFFDDKDDYNVQCNHRMGNFRNVSNLKTLLSRIRKTTSKTTLQQCLPYIKYFHLSGNDILDKIQPFKKILDKQFWKDLMQYLISPDLKISSDSRITCSKKEPFSTIITNEHVSEISSWIDHKSDTYSLADISYEFQLILRGSMNGHSRTVVVMKVQGTDEIFGGYNPLSRVQNLNEILG
ncbi:hypothetical protein Glove_349g137 [Diversispora epigaea]|uniref:TLDc domain-containing protein n=1 Tax=Diversispora epigaea TaxID=1348612 RepID=A0A397HLE5_9GLOM|nr:hypothetical protein Glove_349g137 [Diversispora epigaea]